MSPGRLAAQQLQLQLRCHPRVALRIDKQQQCVSDKSDIAHVTIFLCATHPLICIASSALDSTAARHILSVLCAIRPQVRSQLVSLVVVAFSYHHISVDYTIWNSKASL